MCLKGKKLIDRLEQIKLEEMIDYHGGLLNEDFTKAIVNLYDHVISEGDDQSSPTCIYNAESFDDMKLPCAVLPITIILRLSAVPGFTLLLRFT
jgi:hypothetical protein